MGTIRGIVLTIKALSGFLSLYRTKLGALFHLNRPHEHEVWIFHLFIGKAFIGCPSNVNTPLDTQPMKTTVLSK